MPSRDLLTFIITIIYIFFLYYIGTMLTGYLYIYLYNTYTTAVPGYVMCVRACVRACVGRVALCVVGVTFAPVMLHVVLMLFQEINKH